MKRISIVTPCYNEAENVEELYARVRDAIERAGDYQYEHIFIDNHSEDNTVAVLRRIASGDRRVKVIVNSRNFGQIRSPHHALLQTSGEAVIGLVADLQDPPELIPEMLGKWGQGYAAVLCVKESSAESVLMYAIRSCYYKLVRLLSETKPIEHFTGFGLYDRKIVDYARRFGDANPYFRGMISEIGLPQCQISFRQPLRQRGITKNNFLTLYDVAMLGITSLSRMPLRLITFAGLASAAFAFVATIISMLFAPGSLLLCTALFLGAIQLIALGIVGEYIGAIQTQILNRPLVVEQERINFEFGWAEPRAEASADVQQVASRLA